MEKIEQIETLKNVQTKVAKDFGLQRMLDPVRLTDNEMEKRSKHQLFDALKQEVSSHLSSLDALFNASVVFEENELSVRIVRFLDDFQNQLSSFVTELSSFDEYDEEDDEEDDEADDEEDDEKGGDHEIS